MLTELGAYAWRLCASTQVAVSVRHYSEKWHKENYFACRVYLHKHKMEMGICQRLPNLGRVGSVALRSEVGNVWGEKASDCTDWVSHALTNNFFSVIWSWKEELKKQHKHQQLQGLKEIWMIYKSKDATGTCASGVYGSGGCSERLPAVMQQEWRCLGSPPSAGATWPATGAGVWGRDRRPSGRRVWGRAHSGVSVSSGVEKHHPADLRELAAALSETTMLIFNKSWKTGEIPKAYGTLRSFQCL